MKLTFIVLTYQRGAFLQKCLDSIYMQEGLPRPYEVIVVDNGGDAKANASDDPDIHLRVEVPKENLWATGGRNLGMRLAQGEFLVFIDDDAVWAEPDTVQRMIEHLEENPRCGAVAVKSLRPDGGVIITELPHPNKEYILTQHQPIETPYFYTMGLALRAKALEQAGLYPERFRIYAEEIDLSLRIIDADFTIIYDPDVVVYHYKAEEGRPVSNAGTWQYNALNKSRVAWRLLPFPYPLTTMFVWSVAVLIKTHRPSTVWRVWRDLWDERALLKAERSPIRSQTVAYLKQIGARLWY
jgi:GT2 family glycosyltransferase